MKPNNHPLLKISAPIHSELAHVEQKITETMASDVPLIRDVNQHIIQGGKRVRPITGLLISGLISQLAADTISQQQIVISAIIEFIHTATLLHDDVVDHSTMRRGLETANTIWGNEASVLVGDFLYSRAFQLLTENNQIELMQVLAKASNIMAEGEVLQLMNRNNLAIDEATYFQIIKAKTAVLFEAICHMSALSGTTDNHAIEQARLFGHHLGMAFQLTDDALDYQGNSEQLGKNIGDDLAEGKLTLPLIHCLSVLDNPQDQATIQGIIATSELGPDSDTQDMLQALAQIQALIQKTQSVAYTLELAKSHGQQAMDALEYFADSNYKTALIQLLEFITARTF